MASAIITAMPGGVCALSDTALQKPASGSGKRSTGISGVSISPNKSGSGHSGGGDFAQNHFSFLFSAAPVASG